MTNPGRDPKQPRRLARKIEEYVGPDGDPVKIYVKRASNDDSPIGEGTGPLHFYFRCSVSDSWVTYVIILTDGLRAVLGAKGTREETVIKVALKYVKAEIARGNLVDGTEIEFGPLQEGLFPDR